MRLSLMMAMHSSIVRSGDAQIMCVLITSRIIVVGECLYLN